MKQAGMPYLVHKGPARKPKASGNVRVKRSEIEWKSESHRGTRSPMSKRWPAMYDRRQVIRICAYGCPWQWAPVSCRKWRNANRIGG